jgi:hypothetical protein
MSTDGVERTDTTLANAAIGVCVDLGLVRCEPDPPLCGEAGGTNEMCASVAVDVDPTVVGMFVRVDAGRCAVLLAPLYRAIVSRD